LLPFYYRFRYPEVLGLEVALHNRSIRSAFAATEAGSTSRANGPRRAPGESESGMNGADSIGKRAWPDEKVKRADEPER
jgi:hypothetical protein